MSRLASSLASLFNTKQKESIKLLLVGLDATGRTTALYWMKLGERVNTIPSIGFNVEHLDAQHPTFGKLNITAWDVGGCDKIRPLWRHYFNHTDGIMFFVDSSDPSRFPEAKRELDALISEPVLAGVPVLVLANKQDLPHAIPPNKVAEQLNLFSIPDDHQWICMPAIAICGEGLFEAFAWLQRAVYETRASGSAANKARQSTCSTEAGATDERSVLDQWLAIEDEPDDVFLKALEDYTLDTWDHRTHLRLAWLYLTRHGRREGMDHILKSIKAFIENSPRTKRSSGNGTTFHITLTYAWAHLVHYAIASGKNPDGQFKTFLIINPQLSNGGLLLHYYTKQLLFNSPQARSEVVLPDKRPLPSLLSDVGKPINTKAQSHPQSSLKPSPVTDTEFLRLLKAKSLNSWSHTQFLRVIWACMRFRGGRRGADLAMQLLRDFQGQDSFHYTITYFWCQAIRLLMVHDWAAAMQQLDNAAVNHTAKNFETSSLEDGNSDINMIPHHSIPPGSTDVVGSRMQANGEKADLQHDMFDSVLPAATDSVPEFDIVLQSQGYASQRLQKMSMDTSMYLANYSKACIYSDAAKAGFILPDRKPFASVV